MFGVFLKLIVLLNKKAVDFSGEGLTSELGITKSIGGVEKQGF